ncbi:MAG TPA: class I SAM-dependent methyltransferase [Nitrososphaera sp.]|jgi:ubiquinone/menaquinone biosynthesis C-methylase UbiE
MTHPQKFKAAQRQGWDSVAEGWKKWWKIIEESSQVVSDRLVELGEIRQGSRVLDVATGIGEPALTAARKVGPSGKVTAIDISPAMLAIARERAEQSGLSDIIEFQEADAESLELPPSSFDAIICRFGLMFMPDLVGALKTMRGSLAPSGRIAAAVWSSMDRAPSFLIPFEIVSKETGTTPPTPGSPSVFSLADTSLLRKRFEQAGFNDIKIESSKIDFSLPSPEEYVDFVRSTAASFGAMMAGLPAAKQEEIWNKVADTAREHAADSSTGAVRFTNEVIYVSARS